MHIQSHLDELFFFFFSLHETCRMFYAKGLVDALGKKRKKRRRDRQIDRDRDRERERERERERDV